MKLIFKSSALIKNLFFLHRTNFCSLHSFFVNASFEKCFIYSIRSCHTHDNRDAPEEISSIEIEVIPLSSCSDKQEMNPIEIEGSQYYNQSQFDGSYYSINDSFSDDSLSPTKVADYDNWHNITYERIKFTKFKNLESIDTFSKARVLNFLKRLGISPSTHQGRTPENLKHFKKDEFFRITTILHPDTEEEIFLSSILLSLPEPYGAKIGIGLASSIKDAEFLSAMHAEYIIDELGFSLYQLPSMQRKHAEAARKMGRWAPSPDEPDKVHWSAGQPLPLPLRFLTLNDETEEGKWSLITVKNMCFISPSSTLLSPALFEPKSLERVRQLFFVKHLSFELHCSVLECEETVQNNKIKCFEARIQIPSSLYGYKTVVHSCGKAYNRQTALELAGMHAEMILDALNIPLFPMNPILQQEHALLVSQFGRMAPEQDSSPRNPDHVLLPPGLKEYKKLSNEKRFSCLSYEEDLIRRHCVIANETNEFKLCMLDAYDAKLWIILKKYLKKNDVLRYQNPFFSEKLVKYYRTTIILPLDDSFGVRGGVGIGLSQGEAEKCAILHSIDILHACGVTLFEEVQFDPDPDIDIQQWLEMIEKNGILPPVKDFQYDVKNPKAFKSSSCKSVLADLYNRFLSEKSNSVRSDNPSVTADKIKSNSVIDVSANHQNSSDSMNNAPKSPEDKKNLTIDYSKQRSTHSRDYWCLEADTSDGYIQVSTLQSEQLSGITYALSSPRILDFSVKYRVEVFFASLGKNIENIAVIENIEEELYGQLFYRCIIHIPLPERFGVRMGIGEARDKNEAKILAMMHVELILDTVGIPLFDNPEEQRIHAEKCATCGRKAPLSDEEVADESIPSPPPLRKGKVILSSKNSRPITNSKTPAKDNIPKSLSSKSSFESSKSIPPHKDLLDKSKTKPPANLNHTETKSVLYKSKAEGYNILTISNGIDFRSINSSQIDPVCRIRVSFYLRVNGAMELEPKIITEMIGSNHMVHIASMLLPLPKPFESKTVYGCGSSKREAEILIYMHIEEVLDSLGIPVFNFPKLQKRHALRVKKLNRSAPDVITLDKMRPTTTKIPLPYTTVGGTSASTSFPLPPVKYTSIAWNLYIKAAESFISHTKSARRTAYVLADKSPRKGIDWYDNALTEAESLVDVSSCRTRLQHYCLLANVLYPPLWKWTIVGSSPKRLSRTSVTVPGFTYIRASGVGKSRDASSRRAAAHVLALLRVLDPNMAAREKEIDLRMNSTRSDLSTGNMLITAPDNTSKNTSGKDKRKKFKPSWDWTIKEFTEEGRMRIINLFAICHSLGPPKILEKQYNEDGRIFYSSSVTLTDATGKRWCGIGEEKGREENLKDAFTDLFEKLLLGLSSFKTLTQFIRKHSFLNPEHILNVVIPPSIQDSVNQLLENTSFTDEISSSNAYTSKNSSFSNKNKSARNHLNKYTAVVSSLANQGSDAKCNEKQKIHANNDKYEQKSQELKNDLALRCQSQLYVTKYKEKKERLSIFSKREEIIEATKTSQIVIICGTTGCGKTTQVPQYIFDYYVENGMGASCSILVTQPRRLSAVTIAKRIADERIEPIGKTCGYIIRLDSRMGENINLCTTGILLRMLQDNATLEGISHVILDEVHERDLNSDFLIILVKNLMKIRKDLHIILMSATMQAEHFSDYFAGAPVIQIEGYVYPVRELFLEDLLPIAKSKNAITPLLRAVSNYALSKKPSKASEDPDEDTEPVSWSAYSPGSDNSSSRNEFANVENHDIDFWTIKFAIEEAMVMIDLSESSILVFLPGWDDLIRCKEILEKNQRLHLLLLHSSINSEEQMQCFLSPPSGKTKVILSTNIAESGVTIDDVAVVIDSGKMKEHTYTLYESRTVAGRGLFSSMSQLKTVSASRANCVQRRGRVGRTRPGICIRLYTRDHFEKLHPFQTPEMLRTPLDSLCLTILSLRLGDPLEILQQAIEPPPEEKIRLALEYLRELKAITDRHELTPIGNYMAKLPVNPRYSRMILSGLVLRCLDSLLTVAAASDTDVYLTSREHKEAVRLHREDLSCNTYSDHLASVNGYNFWVTTHHQKSPVEVRYILEEKKMNIPQLLFISKYKQQFYEILSQSDIVDKKLILSYANDNDIISKDLQSKNNVFTENSYYSAYTCDVGLVKCAIATGLIPNVAMNNGKRFFRNKVDNFLSPVGQSILNVTDVSDISQPYFLYEEMINSAESNRRMIKGITQITMWIILLFSTENMSYEYIDELNLGILDGWIIFRSTPDTFETIKLLKQTIDHSIMHYFQDPTDTGNNQRLDCIRHILQKLTNLSNKVSSSIECDWDEVGKIIQPTIGASITKE